MMLEAQCISSRWIWQHCGTVHIGDEYLKIRARYLVKKTLYGPWPDSDPNICAEITNIRAYICSEQSLETTLSSCTVFGNSNQ